MSTGIDWQKVRALYLAALEQPDDARDAWLRNAASGDPIHAAEARRLLNAPHDDGIMADNAMDLLSRLLPQTPAEPGLPDKNVGPYRLIRQLGIGGMGRVFLAERAAGHF